MEPQDELENENLDISPDDELEESRTAPLNSEVGDDPLPGDFDPPAAPADLEPDDPASTIPALDDSHPSKDSDVDETEAYNQGE